MGFAPRALLAAGLGFAASVLVACGGGSNLLSGGQSANLNSQLDAVSTAVEAGHCGGASRALVWFTRSVDNLSPKLSATLRANLIQGVSTVSQLAQHDCRTAATTTTPHTTTTTPTTTTTTTPSTTTTTTPSTTTTTPTTTTTTPATTTTPPGTTSTTPGTGGAGVGGGTTTTGAASGRGGSSGGGAPGQ